MKKPLIIIVLVELLLSELSAAGRSLVNNKAPQFTLSDQYNTPYNIKQDEGKIIILLASDKKGSEQNKAWVESIEKKYKNEIPILGIADVRRVPRAFEAGLKKEFRKKPARILLDWNGDVFKTYMLVQKVANIVLIDKKGFVQYIYSGEATADACERLFKEIDRLDKE
jgi:predicted transcriptional regulator